MNENFYHQFEEKFRGSHNLIKERLKVYLPYIEVLKEVYSELSALDLGCGRGEWLEILQEEGFSATGVDTNEAMLADCRKMDLTVHCAEALKYLQSLDDESLQMVTAFHLVEHIPFSSLIKMVREITRVLKPGGILIFETPNSENLLVGTSQFYIDPTHSQPIPQELLLFIVENSGLKNVSSLRLHETLEKEKNPGSGLYSVFNGVSQDYAVIAQKNSDLVDIGNITRKSIKASGKSLPEAAAEYDRVQDCKINRVEQRAAENVSSSEQRVAKALDSLAQQLGSQAQQLGSQVEQVNRQEQRFLELISESEERVGRAISCLEEKNSLLVQELASIYSSRSWRYTEIIRKIAKIFKNSKNSREK